MEHTFSCVECRVLREAEIDPMGEAKKGELKAKEPCPVCKCFYLKSVNSMTPEERQKYIETHDIRSMVLMGKGEEKEAQQVEIEEEPKSLYTTPTPTTRDKDGNI